MCIIIDTNLYGEFNKEYMKPLREWIEKRNGKIVYSPVGDIGKELNRNGKMKDRLKEYLRAGKAKHISEEEVEKKKQDVVEKLDLESNDPYIIALAKVSNTRLLTSEDAALCSDFKNKKIIRRKRGKIYKAREHKEHKHLLNQNTCP